MWLNFPTVQLDLIRDGRQVDGQALLFPVLYMPDGGVKQDLAHVSHMIDQLIAADTLPPMLVVGVESQDRFRELTSPAKSRRWKEKLPQAGGAAIYHEFFEFELKSEIARPFRVRGMPQGLISEALAGRWVVEGWVRGPERNDVWIAIEASLLWKDKELFRGLEGRLGDRSAHGRSMLYLSGAYRDQRGSLPNVHLFARKLGELGVGTQQLSFESYPNLHHVEIIRGTEVHSYEVILRDSEMRA